MTGTGRAVQSGSCGVGFVCSVSGIKSNSIVKWGIEAVKNLTHRGAVGADGKTGDGAGILLQIPRLFFLRELERAGLRISHIDNLVVGVFFLYGDLEAGIESVIQDFGLKTIGWRDVPTNDEALGSAALLKKPRIRQLLIDAGAVSEREREVRLYLARRTIEKTQGCNVCILTLSSKTIAYKGLLVAPQLDTFYPDLRREDIESAFCVFHQRFSTNTLPDWTMAQPFNVLAHNGEINTIQGNRNWITSLEHALAHEVFGGRDDVTRPLISFDESDSASLDRVVEVLVLAGFSPEQAINVCVPPAWECCDFLDKDDLREVIAFFEYSSLLMRPWDGPAAIIFTDGDTVGAHLDRNGLRPLRYVLTDDGTLVLGSEMGMVDLGGRSIRDRGRLGPGGTLSVTTSRGTLKETAEILRDLSLNKPYREWLERLHIRCGSGDGRLAEPVPEIRRRQIALGYTSEEVETSIKEMAERGREMTFSMGDDTPLPSLAEKPQLLFRYFKQRFSQVTNPSIDPIRERMVMSLRMELGPMGNFLVETPLHARRFAVDSPLLFEDQLREIEEQNIFKVTRVSMTFSRGSSNLSRGLEGLRNEVVQAVRKGAEIVILSDRDNSADLVAIPSLLAVSAAFNYLKRDKLANRASLIVETGEARDVHQLACLIGYGAAAVHPYLVFHTIQEMCEREKLPIPYRTAAGNYRRAIEEGLLKTIARMGVSTIDAYHGAEMFDSVCLRRDFIDEFFPGTPVSIEADGLSAIEGSLMKRHEAAFQSKEPVLDYGGSLKHRKEGEWHAWSTSAVIALNRFIRSGDDRDYRAFSEIANGHPLYLRHLLTYREGASVAVEEVEPEGLILRRFVTGAMSVGALSPEAHETIAEACNRLGMRSNSGEGGEDPERYWTVKNSAVKQLASGRFGVTPAYIASARELEIKVAQGAKPGEGGHLPSIKVTEYIASLRYCSPKTLLISPPPHHDIYSIEDLAQLINDLKQANPEARVCVKLVSERGVGTVAAGVAKAYADIVQISGYEGGTGAAPITSIKNVGNYWEVGLAETQRTLVENGLRDRVRVRVDGGLRTGKDVIIAALFGAEEFGFGTATMIAAGCVMARQCHLNTCPTGIATQDERLRARFKGSIEGVMAYFKALAREVREILAMMGFKSLDDVIGRTDLLTVLPSERVPALARIELGELLKGYPLSEARRCLCERNDNPAPSINERIMSDLLPYIERGETVEKEYEIRNVDRSVPIRINYAIARRYRDDGLPADTIRLMFRGVAGQSFGAFNHRGLSLTLTGDANDYAGKGMFGGRIVIRPSDVRDAHRQVILGNTALYGATGGEFFASGRAGERFAVRNSGATAVVEGTGQHLCEYMTRGTVLVLGDVGYNVGAGMTGGVIYLLDESDTLTARINSSYVKIFEPGDEGEMEVLKALIEDHEKYTESLRAGEIVAAFERFAGYFRKVIPLDPHDP